MLGADRFIDHLTDKQQKLHVEQRYARGFSDIDMWNADTFIADVVVAVCDWTIANGNTSPWKLADGEWHEILREIRAGFASRGDDGAPNPPKSAWNRLRRNMKYMWD